MTKRCGGEEEARLREDEAANEARMRHKVAVSSSEKRRRLFLAFRMTLEKQGQASVTVCSVDSPAARAQFHTKKRTSLKKMYPEGYVGPPPTLISSGQNFVYGDEEW